VPTIIPNKRDFDVFFQPVLKQLQKVIPSLPCRSLACPFPVWKTISVGGKSPLELCGDLVKSGISVDWTAGQLMLGKPKILPPEWELMRKPHFTTLPIPQEISLVRTSVFDMGFAEMPSSDELFDTERLHSIGIDLCPAETAAQLLLQHPEEDLSLEPVIAMEPLSTENIDIGPHMFMPVSRKGGLLRNRSLTIWPGGSIRDSMLWELDMELVFALRPQR
jgi:hypothetical protein